MSFWNIKINKIAKLRRSSLSNKKIMKGNADRIETIKADDNNLLQNKCFKRTVLSASMTIEAAFIIPLFVFFTVILIQILNLINFQNRVNESMYNTGRTLSKLEYSNEGSANSMLALGMLYTGIDRETIAKMGVVGGLIGINATGSSFDDEDIDFVVNYLVKTPFDMLRVRDINCAQKIKIRKWIGNEDKGEGGAVNEDDRMVYIAETGTVYHADRNCTYLVLSIKEIPSNGVESMRNSSGGKYYPCERCMKKGVTSGALFITDYGDRYHCSRNCSGLKRAVFTVPLRTVMDWNACSRCGG